MRQQINLYQDVLIDKPEPFQGRLAILVLLATSLVMLAFVAFQYWQTTTLQKQIVPLEQQKQVLAVRIASLEKQYPQRQVSPLLQEKITRLEREIQGQKKAIDYFSIQRQSGNNMILGSLEGLARYRQPGVWLRRISLLRTGQGVDISGSAVRAEQIPEYLKLLGDKNVFGGKVFSRLQLKRLEDQGGRIEFNLNSGAGAN